MQLRESTPADDDSIRAIAERSLEASYPLDAAVVERAVEQWYSDEALAEKRDDDDVFLLVAEDDGEPVGFSESVLVDGRGDVLWLLVDPSGRGAGVGAELFAATTERLRDAGVETVRGLVLEDNEAGNMFYRDRGLTHAGTHEVEIGGETYVENIYLDERPAGLEPVEVDEGELYIDRTDVERGVRGAFYVLYSDDEGESRYGYYCDNCGNVITAMDSMGRMECGNCGNRLLPTRWDAAYL